jgi:hypothetical protein
VFGQEKKQVLRQRTMTRRNWKKVYPTSLPQAMEMCLQYALEKKNLSVQRVAELMGMSSHWALYKWVAEATMPAKKIKVFEYACGINFVTQYQAHSSNHLLIPMPTGKKANHQEINEVMLDTSVVMSQLFQHAEDGNLHDELMAGLTQLMEGLAYQRGNIEKEQQPELEL